MYMYMYMYLYRRAQRNHMWYNHIAQKGTPCMYMDQLDSRPKYDLVEDAMEVKSWEEEEHTLSFLLHRAYILSR